MNIVTPNPSKPTPVNAFILFVRFVAAHLLWLATGLLLSLLTLPLWTWPLYWLTAKTGQASWGWYLLTLAPFYVAVSTLIILVLYPMWTGASDRSKRWKRILNVTAWIHLSLLILINLIVGSRFLP